MDIGDTEKKGNFLSKILVSSDPKDLTTSPTSDFERELFENGVYEFDFDKEIQKSEEHYRSKKEWLRHPGWVSRAQSVLDDLVNSENWDLAWKQAFSGRIPKSWGVWHGPMEAFPEAGKRNVQLSPILINAGVSHFHHLVVNETGKNQKLSSEQLGLVLGREDDIPPWNSDQIIATQWEKRMTQQEFHKAEEFASVVREKIRKARNKRARLGPPKPQLNDKSQGGEV